MRKWIWMLLLLMPPFAGGCGSGVTNENVREKVFTQKDLDEIQEQQKKMTELGIKGLTPNATSKPGASKTGP